MDTPDNTQGVGRTPVFIAAQGGNMEAIIALHAAGANVDTPTWNKATPIYIAAENGHPKSVAALLEVGADASVKTPWGTALERARQQKHGDVVRILEAHFKQYPNGIKLVEIINKKMLSSSRL